MSNEKISELRSLLAEAEKTIVALNEEAGAYKEIIQDLVATKDSQVSQLSEMKERVQELESIIHVSDEQLSEAAIIMNFLATGVEKLRVEAKETLEAAEQGVSSVELKNKVRSISDTAEWSNETSLLDEYKKKLAELREKTKPAEE